jgi:SAM-dependent methyltransferase
MQNSNKNDQYNDESYNYQNYWISRNYENQAELIAIKKLLKDRHFNVALDIGGGYGRLSIVLEKYADKVYLTDSSKRQLQLAETFLLDHNRIDKKIMVSDNLKFNNNTVDLVNLVRIMHHLPDPLPTLSEIHRVLRPGGMAIIEMANYDHFLNRLKHIVKLQRFPIEPVDIRSEANKSKDEIPFVNHNPKTVRQQLIDSGFVIEDYLSVSNLRSTLLKRLIPLKVLLKIETMTQQSLRRCYFGPSIFFLVKKP